MSTADLFETSENPEIIAALKTAFTHLLGISFSSKKTIHRCSKKDIRSMTIAVQNLQTVAEHFIEKAFVEDIHPDSLTSDENFVDFSEEAQRAIIGIQNLDWSGDLDQEKQNLFAIHTVFIGSMLMLTQHDAKQAGYDNAYMKNFDAIANNRPEIAQQILATFCLDVPDFALVSADNTLEEVANFITSSLFKKKLPVPAKGSRFQPVSQFIVN